MDKREYLKVRCPKCHKLLCKVDKDNGISKNVNLWCRNCKCQYKLDKEMKNYNVILVKVDGGS